MISPVRAVRERALMTQVELAVAAGTSQPTIASYEAGRKSPTLRTLQRLADAVGFDVHVQVHSPLTREARRSLALHEAIAERLKRTPVETLRQARATLRRMRRTQPHAKPLLRQWATLLERPVDALLPVLTDPGEYSRELRAVTPFAGVLSARERADCYRAFRVSESAR